MSATTSGTPSRTALHAEHLALGAKMTEFHGWDMPLYYTSILEEHAAVRNLAAIFDISHMGQVLVEGPDALESLNQMVVSDLSNVGDWRACYTLLLNERGGIVDDLIIYRLPGGSRSSLAFGSSGRLNPQRFLVIVNCANREKDIAWLQEHKKPQTVIRHISQGRSILAIQGPRSVEILERVLNTSINGLGRFSMIQVPGWAPETWISRTGYTGSDGFELFLPDREAVKVWKRFVEIGRPLGCLAAGLGSRDTLRLEAGLRLYGTDMDDQTSPYEADLGWTVAIHKDNFIGKPVLEQQKAAGVSRKLIGFELPEGPMPRHGCALTIEGRTIGSVTSGTYSLMLSRPIGFGLVEIAHAKPGTALHVVIRNKPYPATVVKLPFWRLPKPELVGS